MSRRTRYWLFVNFPGKRVKIAPSLLDFRTARVFLIGANPVDGSGGPFFFARDRQDVTSGQLLGNSASCHSLKEKPEDEPHDLGLLLVDSEIAVLTFIVAEKVRVSDGELFS